MQVRADGYYSRDIWVDGVKIHVNIKLPEFPKMPRVPRLEEFFAPPPPPPKTKFADYLKFTVQGVRELRKEAKRKTMQFVLGEIEDVHDVIIARQKAGVAFRLLLDMRNRALRSFEEIMRMQF